MKTKTSAVLTLILFYATMIAAYFFKEAPAWIIGLIWAPFTVVFVSLVVDWSR